MKKLFLLIALLTFSTLTLPLSAQDDYEDDEYYYEDEGYFDNYYIGLGAHINFPMGKFGDFYGSGIGAYLSGGYRLVENLQVDLSVQFVYWSKLEEFVPSEFKSETFYVIPIILTPKYFLTTNSNFNPYIGLDLGYYMGTHTLTIHDDTQVNNNRERDEIVNYSGIGFAPVVGAYIPFGDDLDLEGKVKYNFINQPDNTFLYDETISNIAVELGLIYHF